MSYEPHPLHPSLIRPGDPVYRVDLAPETQETLRRRAEQVHPTMRTTAGRPEWRVGRSTDPPRSTSTPVIFSPTMLEPGGGSPASATPSIADVVARLKP